MSKAVNSFEDLVASDDHQYILRNNSLYHFVLESSSDPLFKAIWEKVERQGLENSLVNRAPMTLVLDNKNMVVSSDMEFLKLQVKLRYSSRSGESVLHVSREGVFPSGIAIPMRKNAPFAEAINKW
jgi:hypothetical protein